MNVSVLPSATSSRSPLPYWKRTLPGRFSCSVPDAERPRASVWVKSAVIVWTPPICAFSRARSADVSAAAAGAAIAISTTGASARAKDQAEFMFMLLGDWAENWPLRLECAVNSAVPRGSASDRVPVGVDQHLTPADVVGLADEP